MTTSKATFERELKGGLRRQNLRLILSCLLVAGLAIGTVFGSEFFIVKREYEDWRGMPILSHEGTVIGIIYNQRTRGWNPNGNKLITVDIGGLKAQTYSDSPDSPVATGQKFQVQYRIGRSGRAYVHKMDAISRVP